MNNTENILGKGQPLLSKVLEKSIEKINDCAIEANTEGTYRNLVMHVFFQAVAVRNEFAIDFLMDCFKLIRDNKEMYRHEVKKYLRQAEKEKSKYCAKVSVFAYTDEMLDFLDGTSKKFEERISNSCKTFYLTIRKEMLDRGVKNADFFAKIEMCYVILDTITEIYNEESKSEFEMKYSIQQLDYMKIEKLRYIWKLVCGSIYKNHFPS